MMFTKITSKISESIAKGRKAIENVILNRIRFYSDDAKVAVQDCVDQVDFIVEVKTLLTIDSDFVRDEVSQRILVAKEIYETSRSNYAKSVANLQKITNLISKKNQFFSKLVPNWLVFVAEAVEITGILGFKDLTPELPEFPALIAA